MSTASSSGGVLLFRRSAGRLEVLIAHPGGPFWARRDEGAWSIPKGEAAPGEGLREAAVREFTEETGAPLPDGPLIHLGSVTQKAGKVVEAWAIEGDFDPDRLVSSRFSMEWPPRSGRVASFPEIDRVEWVDVDTARRKLNPAQVDLVARLVAVVGADEGA